MIADITATAALCGRCLNPLMREDAPCLVCPTPGESLRDPETVGPYQVERALGSSRRGHVYVCDDGTGGKVALRRTKCVGED